MVRVRFAPSPTGFLHIGGSRTALFNWLYARAKGGKFILRIEDTDVKRSRPEYLEEILDSLSWMGFNWDEIYYQSKRFDIYREIAERLLQEGKAYRASPSGTNAEGEEDGTEIEKKQDAIIFKVAQQKVVFNDLIHGEISFDTGVIKDQVLIKSDGTPTYNFACVVDDAAMNINHVIRGDDHISNTPKQILLYQALNFSVPEYAHLPLILGSDGGRLSKRTGATAISDYRRMGYLPEALVNYLLLLGWSPGGNQEIIGIRDAIKKFDIKNANKTAATFDMGKLNWINNQYIKTADTLDLSAALEPFLKEQGLDVSEFSKDYLLSVVKLFQGRLGTLQDFPAWADFLFKDDFAIDPQAKEKHLTRDFSREFKLFADRLQVLEPFDIVTIEECFRGLLVELGLQSRELIHPVRVALTGKTIGPGLFEVIYYLGKERVSRRLMAWVKQL
ncbi:MAG: glutamate--tRNA ligase [Elusimicrobia bacterium]|nr:glutamate--tRNA ligase [Elusimicrobiota bacterium]